jgi:SnoaL-like domain
MLRSLNEWLAEGALMTESEQMLAVEEIKQAKARYFRCMDTKDWAGFEAVFAPDATVDYTPPGGKPADWSFAGRANIMGFVRKTVELALTVHHGHMPEVEMTSPTTARATFAMEDLIWWPEGSRRRTLHGWGHYHETYEKIDGKWLIKTLRLTRLRVEET